jgi:DNA-binding SARP family transcriptional activator
MATILDPGSVHATAGAQDAPEPASSPPGQEPEPEHVAAIRLSLLDAFELSIDGVAVAMPPIAQRLLAFLALHERPVLREYVSGCLWSGMSTGHASASLRAELGWLPRGLLHATATHLRLAPEVSVDLRAALDGARTLLDPHSQVVDGDFEEFLLSGEVLPGWDDDWVLIERERLRQLRLHALEALCARLTAAGRLAEAIDAGLAAVAADPLRESAHRVLIQAHLAEGNRAEAVRQCEAYREILWSGMGVSPSPLLGALMTGGLADPQPDAGGGGTPRGQQEPRAKETPATSAHSDSSPHWPPVPEEEAR